MPTPSRPAASLTILPLPLILELTTFINSLFIADIIIRHDLLLEPNSTKVQLII